MTLSGRVSLENAEELKRMAVSALASEGIEVDWTGAEYLSGSALQVLLALAAAARREGKRLKVTEAHPDAQRYLAVSGFAGRFLSGEPEA